MSGNHQKSGSDEKKGRSQKRRVSRRGVVQQKGQNTQQELSLGLAEEHNQIEKKQRIQTKRNQKLQESHHSGSPPIGMYIANSQKLENFIATHKGSAEPIADHLKESEANFRESQVKPPLKGGQPQQVQVYSKKQKSITQTIQQALRQKQNKMKQFASCFKKAKQIERQSQRQLEKILRKKEREIGKVIKTLKDSNAPQQAILKVKNSPPPKDQQKYYEAFSEKRNEYLNTMRNFSEKFKVDPEQEFIYKQSILSLVNQIGIERLTDSLHTKDQNEMRITLQTWKTFEWINEKLFEEEINLSPFKMLNQYFQKRARKLFFQRSFKNIQEIIRSSSEVQLKLRIKEIQNAIENQPAAFYPHFVKPSQIYKDKELKQNLQQLVEIVKNSWLIRQNLGYYMFDVWSRSRYYSTFMKINQENIKKALLKLKVFFVDCPMEQLCGVTQTIDDSGQYPIFINLYKIERQQKKQKNIGVYLSYTLFVLVHESGHAVPRIIKIIQDDEDSNPYIITNKKLRDGGWMLQNLVFGGCIREGLSNDYSSVKNLLQIRERPKDFYLDLNLKEYNTLKSNLNNEDKANKKDQPKNKRNVRDKVYDNEVTKQIQKLTITEMIPQIQSKKKQQLSKAQKNENNHRKDPIEMYLQKFQKSKYQGQKNQRTLGQKERQQLQNSIKTFFSFGKRTGSDLAQLKSKDQSIVSFKTKENPNTFQVRPDIFYSEVASMIYLKSGYRE